MKKQKIGDAELKLVGSEDPLKAGLEVLASPPYNMKSLVKITENIVEKRKTKREKYL